MTDIAEYERRISFALERIARGVETLTAGGGVSISESLVVDVPEDDASAAQIAELRDALEAERTANAQLSERVRAIREKQETTLSTMEKRLAQATRSYEGAQVELARLKRANADLAEANRALIEAGNDLAPHLINRALQAELESLRAARAAEVAELGDILDSIEPLIEAQEQMGAGDHA
ncbi:hypothetical protein O5O51_08825 [Sinirhodobacter sp. HNIBRBA609]|nr:hypothetical protein O5O51_08825 [Sinirhodobacter sp. HNIBRBA609]